MDACVFHSSFTYQIFSPLNSSVPNGDNGLIIAGLGFPSHKCADESVLNGVPTMPPTQRTLAERKREILADVNWLKIVKKSILPGNLADLHVRLRPVCPSLGI